mmetsp:Transcript_7988/g.26294  ORF Transcript_7988/g.26294 Transcript_7988/m.26294 type:complete len:156 (+) Transcript_7988:57-524(+)
MARQHLGIVLVALCAATGASALRVGGTSRSLPHFGSRPASTRSEVIMREYSTKVKITAEARAPLRQARIFFLYPSTIAGASIAAYVSVTRLIAGLGGFRTDLTPLSDAGNLALNLGVVAAAVWALRNDLNGRAQLLEDVALELEGPLEADADIGS